jgi:hypothetical protein
LRALPIFFTAFFTAEADRPVPDDLALDFSERKETPDDDDTRAIKGKTRLWMRKSTLNSPAA